MHMGKFLSTYYSTLHRSPELEPHHQIQFSIILRSSYFAGMRSEVLSTLQGVPSAVSVNSGFGVLYRVN